MEKFKPKGNSKTGEIVVKGNWEEISRSFGGAGLTVELLGGDHLGSEQNSKH